MNLRPERSPPRNGDSSGDTGDTREWTDRKILQPSLPVAVGISTACGDWRGSEEECLERASSEFRPSAERQARVGKPAHPPLLPEGLP
jgi:hypothetical protein